MPLDQSQSSKKWWLAPVVGLALFALGAAGSYLYNSVGIMAIVNATPGSATTVQVGASDEYHYTLGANLTTTLSASGSNLIGGVWNVTVRYCEGGVGGYTVTYASSSQIVFSAVPGGGAPIISNTAPGACEVHRWRYSQPDNTWYLTSIEKNNPPALAGVGACPASPAGMGVTAVGTAGPTCATVGTVHKLNTQVGTPLATLTNSSSPTTLFTYTLPANTLGNTGWLDCDWIGDYTNGSGGNSTLTLQATFGARTLTAFSAVTATTIQGEAHVHLKVFNKGAANANTAWATGDICNAGASNNLTGGNCNGSTQQAIYSVAAQDTTSNQAITLVVTESVADAGITFNLWGGTCTYVTSN